jgi:hypothetical protein
MVNTSEGVELFFNGTFSGIARVELFDINGAVITAQDYNTENNRLNIDMRAYAEGAYVVRVVDGTTMFTGKFVWTKR